MSEEDRPEKRSPRESDPEVDALLDAIAVPLEDAPTGGGPAASGAETPPALHVPQPPGEPVSLPIRVPRPMTGKLPRPGQLVSASKRTLPGAGPIVPTAAKPARRWVPEAPRDFGDDEIDAVLGTLSEPPPSESAGQPARSAAPANEPVGQPATAAPANEPVGQPATAAPANEPVGQPATAAPAKPAAVAPSAPKQEAPSAPRHEAPSAPKQKAPSAPKHEVPAAAKPASVGKEAESDAVEYGLEELGAVELGDAVADEGLDDRPTPPGPHVLPRTAASASAAASTPSAPQRKSFESAPSHERIIDDDDDWGDGDDRPTSSLLVQSAEAPRPEAVSDFDAELASLEELGIVEQLDEATAGDALAGTEEVSLEELGIVERFDEPIATDALFEQSPVSRPSEDLDAKRDVIGEKLFGDDDVPPPQPALDYREEQELGSAPEVAAERWEEEPEQPAAVHLARRELTAEWIARAEWFEQEAAANPEAGARAYLAASELWAMIGEVERARSAAKRAMQAEPSLALAARQARQLAAVDGDYKAVTPILDVEARAATDPEARAHAAYLCAEVHRLVLRDPESAQRKLEQSFRALSTDPRPHVARLVGQLESSTNAPKVRWPDAAELAELAGASAELVRLRSRTPPADATELTPVVAFEVARRALAAGDRSLAAAAVGNLAAVKGLEGGTLWLRAALLAPDAAERQDAIAALAAELEREPSVAAVRALAARALEHGDAVALAQVLAASTKVGEALSPADRLALAALTGSDADVMRSAVADLVEDERYRPLAAAATAVATPGAALPTDSPGDALAATGRQLGAAESLEDLARVTAALESLPEQERVRQAFSLEVAVRQSALEDAAVALADTPPGEDTVAGRAAAALIVERAGSETAASHYAALIDASPALAETAVRALLDAGAAATGHLARIADALEGADPERQALLLLEAAMRTAPEHPDVALELATRAADLAPNMPITYNFATQLCRAQGDAARLVDWLEKNRSASTDPTERALDAVREALLAADDNPDEARALLESALEARPEDVALRVLYERLAPPVDVERGRWREQLAMATPDERTRARLLLVASHEYERAGALDAAARTAIAAASAGGGSFAEILANQLAPQTTSAADRAAQLEQAAKAETDPIRRRELYEELSWFEAARGDSASALSWHQVVREGSPDYLPSLRRLEHEYIGAGRDADLLPIAEALSVLPDAAEASAHARLAVRLMFREGPWERARPVVERAAQRKPVALWLLREKSAQARAALDFASALEADRALFDRSKRTLDRASLALRAAEAAARLERDDDALELLDHTLAEAPEHPVALSMRADVRERRGDAVGAAADLEALARASHVAEHQADLWRRAAALWMDRAGDPERGLAALEQAAGRDASNNDTFERLQLLYVQRGDRAKLADLLERRLAATPDPEERVTLEVTRGRALADLGDRKAAREALNAALEANPDHADALDAYAKLCAADGDWTSAEQAWIKLARVVPEPERQADIYIQLAELYDERQPNPQRAELCYREVLKRRPDDPETLEKLVLVHARLGELDKALALQNDLIERAPTPEGKRAGTVGLARVHEIAGDPKRALQTLEGARKTWPHDAEVLRALGAFHERQGQGPAAKMLLDRATADARRALAHGRFDLSFFKVLSTVAEIRGNTEAAAIAHATIGALEGGPSRIEGARVRAADLALDDLLAPDLLAGAFRALLKKLPGVFDAAFSGDLPALRAEPPPEAAQGIVALAEQLAGPMGLRKLEVLVSPDAGPTVVAASSTPPVIIVGQELISDREDLVTVFLLFRALKVVQAQLATLSRLSPVELWPAIAALLNVIAPSFQPQGVDAKRLSSLQDQVRRALPDRFDDDVPTLALEVGGYIGSRASQLATATHQWGDRVGLLAVGDPLIALQGISLSSGQGKELPADAAERLKWVLRNAEARDLAVFSVSESYTEARKQLGLAGRSVRPQGGDRKEDGASPEDGTT